MAVEPDAFDERLTAIGDPQPNQPARRKGKFFYLFVALLGLVATYPFFEVGGPRTVFLFVTLTTLGYGDVFPLTPRARSLAMFEAIVGVLFVALLVARLVGLYGRKTREP